jgi:hypothetical protein
MPNANPDELRNGCIGWFINVSLMVQFIPELLPNFFCGGRVGF